MDAVVGYACEMLPSKRYASVQKPFEGLQRLHGVHSNGLTSPVATSLTSSPCPHP